MTDTVTETNSKAKGFLLAFAIIIVIAVMVWAAWLFFWEEPETEEPTTKPCVCEEVKPEAPVELPETGYDGE